MPIRRLSLRLSLATVVLLLLGISTTALAKTYAIEVQTDPSGAKVYLNNKRGKLLGKTPFRGSLSAGDHTLYITKRGYDPVYQLIDVKKKNGGRQNFDFQLSSIEYGTVRVEAAGSGSSARKIKGAKVYIDGNFVGSLPDTFNEISTGPHQVEVKKPGYDIFDEWIEVEEGETTTVKVDMDADPNSDVGDDDDDDDDDLGDDDDDDLGDDDDDDLGDDDDDDLGDDDDDDGDKGDDDDDDDGDKGDDDDDGDGDDDDDDDGDDDDDDDDDDNLAGATRDAPRSNPYITIAVGPEAGNRSFQYNVAPGVNDAKNVRPYDAPLVPLVRVRAQIFPLAGLSNGFLAGIGFSGYFAQAASVTSETSDKMKLKTKWSEWNANLRFKYNIGDIVIGTEAGLASQTFGFVAGNDMSGTLLSEVPSVDYRYLRLGLDAGIHLTPGIVAWAGFDYRIVSGVGTLVDAYAETQVLGIGGQLGITVELTRSIELQGLLNLSRYTHTFLNLDSSNNKVVVAAGTDQFIGAMIGVAYKR